MQEISLSLSLTAMLALQEIAGREDASLGQIIRDAIERDLRCRAEAKAPIRADERLVSPLRVLLARDLEISKSWGELDARLRAKGYVLREAGGGLVLNALATNARQCNASELGFSYTALTRRFNQPFPGHSHNHILYPVRVEPTQAQPSPQ